jgi:aminoglycoside phosphotransferase (APT) family kinase protein
MQTGAAMPPERQLTFDLDRDQALAVVAGLDPSLRPEAVTRLNGGSTEVYRIDLASGHEPLVLKIYADEPAWAPAKEALVAGWLTDWGELPTPRWLTVDETRQLLPLRYALTTWLPGETVRSLKGAPGILGAYRQMGEWLRRLHGLPMNGYGYVRGEGVIDPRSTNANYMATAFEGAFRCFVEQGGDTTLAHQLERAAHARLPLASHSAGPVFAHDDFQPGNLLAVQDTGAPVLSGLIDFGNARAADPLFDLAKALFCCAHEDPRSSKPLLEGYGPIDHPDADGVLWLYTLHHRLTMWFWLTRVGASPEDGPADLLRDLRAMA